MQRAGDGLLAGFRRNIESSGLQPGKVMFGFVLGWVLFGQSIGLATGFGIGIIILVFLPLLALTVMGLGCSRSPADQAQADVHDVPDQTPLIIKSVTTVALQLLKRHRNIAYADETGRVPPSIGASSIVTRDSRSGASRHSQVKTRRCGGSTTR